MRLATSYFGNRIPRHARRDMEALRALGFTRVVHTFAENDLAFYRATMGEIVQISQDCGLEVLLDPWGVARIFGGEAFSQWLVEDPDLRQRGPSGRPLGGACLNHPRLRDRMGGWIEAAAETGAGWVFWDEPHWTPRGPANPEGEICVCEHCRARGGDLARADPEEAARFRSESIVRLLADLVGLARAADLASSICLLPQGVLEQPALPWERIAALPGVAEFGTDPYWQAFGITAPEARDRFLDAQAAAAHAAARGPGLPVMLWLQAFRVRHSQEADLLAGARRLMALRPETLALWGFEGCAHMSGLACERGPALWRQLIELLRSARD